MNIWIEWHGGDCPPVSGEVEVRFRDDNDEYGFTTDRAEHWYWKHEGDDCDIVAYRIVRSDDDICDDVEADMETTRCISAEQDASVERDFDLARPSGYYWLVSITRLGTTPAIAHWSRDICRWHFCGVDHGTTTAKLAEDGWHPTGVALRYSA